MPDVETKLSPGHGGDHIVGGRSDELGDSSDASNDVVRYMILKEVSGRRNSNAFFDLLPHIAIN